MVGCVYIVAVNYNGRGYLEEFMESLECQTYNNFKLIFVDNCSPDGSGRWFEEHYPQYEVIFQPTNIGFARGCNIGIYRAQEEGAEYILLLNIDTVLENDLLEELVKYSKGAAVTVPKIYSTRDKMNIWYGGGSIDYGKGTNVHYHDTRLEESSARPFCSVDFATGCCMLIPASVLSKVGYLDEKFYMYYDDVDLSVRIKKAQVCMYYVPSASLWHKVGGSYKGARNILTEYYFTRNRLYFIKKHKELMKISCHKAAWEILKRKVIKADSNGKKYIPYVLSGIRDFYFNRLYKSPCKF